MEQESNIDLSTHSLHNRRPLSPHLGIYKLQLTSGTSILHRITGAYLYFGIIMLSWAIFCLVYFPYILENIEIFLNGKFIFNALFKIMLLSWTYALFYHQLNGIRHLFWDAGKGFDIRISYITGKLVIALSILLTIICWAAI
jgi:succinate dehydrogenase / fumarate reductase, cytochrome b subunit